jgi:hypothetical protein
MFTSPICYSNIMNWIPHKPYVTAGMIGLKCIQYLYLKFKLVLGAVSFRFDVCHQCTC